MLKVEGCPSGESPVTPRKRLHSAEDARCSSRPPPEGAGSVSISESEEKGGFCQQCQKKVAELKKQALALADQNSLKVGLIFFFILFYANIVFKFNLAIIYTLKGRHTVITWVAVLVLQYFLLENSQNISKSQHVIASYSHWNKGQQPLSL